MTPTDGARRAGTELVVLLDAAGRPCGQMPKALVHHADTPLHLAFSCWVQRPDGCWLLTRRAASKPTWPDFWTNAFCGHPAPDEALPTAVRRRARTELGLTLDTLEAVLPGFRYRAVMDNGVVENELCPVYRATLTGSTDPRPDPDEVGDWRWAPIEQLRRDVADDPTGWSPWMREQLDALTRVGTV